MSESDASPCGRAVALIAVLAVAAAGCGGDDRGAKLADRGPRLVTRRDQGERARGGSSTSSSGPVRHLTKEFKAATGCTVKTKDGGNGDDMISLIQSGEYDGVSASGHTSVRLMAAGDVAPVNTDLLPNYADVRTGSSSSPTTRRTESRTAPRTAAARTPHVPDGRRHPGSGQLGRSGRRPARSTRARSRSTTTRSSSRTLPST